MNIIKETCVAGACIDTTYKFSTRFMKHEGKRAPRMNPTPEDVWKVNTRNAERDLARILNHNFGPGDWHLVLTYRAEPTAAEAKKHKEYFCRLVKGWADRNGKKFKWIAVTEYKHARIHHHVVCSHLPLEIINELWKRGHVRVTPLDKTRNYTKLAHYLVKETSKTYRDPDSVNHRRWTCSRNIVRPEVKRQIVSEREIYKDIKPLKGYYIDQDSIRRYDHKVTGLPHLEYIQVATEQPRYKRWYKGATVKRTENYNHLLRHEKQLAFSMIGEVDE